MQQAFTDADVSSFLKDIIELGGCNVVDDSPDKNIRLKSTGDLVTISTDGRAVPLAIFGTRATDAIIINPFAEGESETAKNTWFYSSRNMILAAHVVKIMKVLLQTAIDSKKKGGDDSPNRDAVALVSKYTGQIDEKMLKEFDDISGNLYDFLGIHWNKSTKRGELKCLVMNEAQRKAYGKVRTKTWDVFQGLIFNILNVKSLTEFDYLPSIIGLTVFESFANILVHVYDNIAPALKVIDREEPAVGTLKSHLKYLGEYYARAKWCVSPNPAVVPVGQAAPTAPWQVPGPMALGQVPYTVQQAVVPGPVPVQGNPMYNSVPGPQYVGAPSVMTQQVAVPGVQLYPMMPAGIPPIQSQEMAPRKSSNPFSR